MKGVKLLKRQVDRLTEDMNQNNSFLIKGAVQHANIYFMIEHCAQKCAQKGILWKM